MIPAELPISEEEWVALVRSVASWGDRAESRAIELKGGDLKPSSKEGAAKVARFVLGAANRKPPEEDDVLDGFAIMLIGVESDGTLSGAAAVETHEVTRLVAKYVGDEPRWSLKWISVDESTAVLAVVVRPSRAGDPPFVARADGVGISSGDVYVRRNGETSKASATEFDALMDRAAGAAPALPQLAVEFTGTAGAFVLSEVDFMIPIRGRARELNSALDRAVRTDTRSEAQFRATTALGLGLGGLLAQKQFEPEGRTEDEYRNEVATWERDCAARYEEAVEGLVPYVGRPGLFRLTNTSTRYLTDVEVSIHVPGSVFAHRPEGRQVRRSEFIPRSPRPWGPIERPGWADIAASARLQPYVTQSYLPSMPPHGPRARFDNTGSIDVTLTVPELRPSAVVDFDDDECVLAWRGPEMPETVTGRWTATARGLDAVLSGQLEIQCGPVTDMADFWTGRAYASSDERGSGG